MLIPHEAQVEAVEGLYVPGLQVVHTVAIVLLDVPAAQDTQDVAVEALNLPATQEVQAEAGGILYCPGLQDVQTKAVVLLNVAGLHIGPESVSPAPGEDGAQTRTRNRGRRLVRGFRALLRPLYVHGSSAAAQASASN